jgi:hypothetical protein
MKTFQFQHLRGQNGLWIEDWKLNQINMLQFKRATCQSEWESKFCNFWTTDVRFLGLLFQVYLRAFIARFLWCLKAIFYEKNELSSCAKRESLNLCAFNCSSLIVFVLKYNFSSTTTKAYWSSNIEDQEE